ncbi:uncharacterized protein SCHCODRAFT_02581932 [Schizophyllum commune H4-8]|nr:uncharacterized protein SCHCODRAFT_02581932 [Schizophyllum commune H4-8]KAI5891783.1 hypothetical protein SCHCODRAFT_02581932 [Schizophyllum commune H4-8]
MPKASTSKVAVASGSQMRSGKASTSDGDAQFTRSDDRSEYDIFTSGCASAAHLLTLVRVALLRDDLTKIYGIDMTDVLPIGEDAVLKRIVDKAFHHPITAHRLRLLIIRGNNTDPIVRTELADVLRALELPHLKAIKILRPGFSCRYFEEAVYLLLFKAGKKGVLKHVSLQWNCTYGAGLTRYLESSATANLVTLRLQTNADVRTRITDALGRGHRFPKLRRLSLVHIQGLTPALLLDTLQTRFDRGLRNRLVVEITGEVPKAVVKAGREINVVFRSVGETLLEKAQDL